MDSLVLDTVIGIVFVFATFALVISLLTELIARFFGLRGEYLMRGLRTLVDGTKAPTAPAAGAGVPAAPAVTPEAPEIKLALSPWDLVRWGSEGQPDALNGAPKPVISQIMEKSYINNSAYKGKLPANAGNASLTNKLRRQLPSYLSSRSFATAVVDLFIPTADGKTTIDAAKVKIAAMPDGPLRDYLATLLTSAGQDIGKLRKGIEQWYDDHMTRVSGWYKRHVRWISLVIGLVVVLSFNVNAVSVARAMYTDEALRESVVSQAVAASDCGKQAPEDCLKVVQDQIGKARDAGLPIGWSVVAACQTKACDWPETRGLADPDDGGWADVLFFVIVLVGWLIMVLALLPGARFWFDLLGRLGSLRSTGPKPAPSS